MTNEVLRQVTKNASITILTIGIIISMLAPIEAQIHHYVIIKKIENGTVYYQKYDFAEEQTLNISDLILWEQAIQDKAITNTLYSDYDSEKIRLLLLKEGFARLKDSANAPPEELNAQNSAALQKKRIWSESSPQPPGGEEGITWGEIFGYTWKLILLLASFGIVTAVARKAYKTLYLQRRVKILIFGEPSSGKSALRLCMVDPYVSKKDLLNLEKTKALNEQIGLKHIPRGKFEIIPIAKDVPGSAFATVWDEMTTSSNHVLLIVLSPYKANGVQADNHVELLDLTIDIDRQYIDIQVGYVQAYVEGGLGSKTVRKPKLVIMFINKFDLFCKTKPDDTASKNARRAIERIFSDHIDSAKSAAKKAGIPFELLIGSAVEKWHTEEILNLTAKTLYKA